MTQIIKKSLRNDYEVIMGPGPYFFVPTSFQPKRSLARDLGKSSFGQYVRSPVPS